MQNGGPKGEIRIQQALTLIHTSYEEILVSFVTVSGQYRKNKRVRLGVPPSEKKPKALSGIDSGEPKKSWNHQINRSHNLLLFDVEKQRPFELKICLLTSVNNLKIRWHVKKGK
jgi:hypothetical protein